MQVGGRHAQGLVNTSASAAYRGPYPEELPCTAHWRDAAPSSVHPSWLAGSQTGVRQDNAAYDQAVGRSGSHRTVAWFVQMQAARVVVPSAMGSQFEALVTGRSGRSTRTSACGVDHPNEGPRRDVVGEAGEAREGAQTLDPFPEWTGRIGKASAAG